MDKMTSPIRRRGRPPKISRSNTDTQALLISIGLAVLTEQGFSATGIETILKQAQVPKGSFYHYFESKNAYGLALIEAYDNYFQTKLKRHLNNETLPVLERIVCFANDAKIGMVKYDFKRGCLIGNLNQELAHLDPLLIRRLSQAYYHWENILAECLFAAQQQQQIAKHIDCQQLAEFFWTGWEGAVMRAKLNKSTQPLTLFASQFLRLVI
ncbi:TetR family transcriptional regulator C-terminal domain-containing protein [Pseudoalteromonas mariniglutinosa]|uniref:acrylate utilization transcriptional regulator AcuR n=1 Tax=Pseudoalteromonas mariniglutinosa TaxID=206042 RepID=UPI003850C82B